MRRLLEILSCSIHGAVFRDPNMSLCARAWVFQEDAFWAVWVLVWDWLAMSLAARAMRVNERHHCRNSFLRLGK